MLKCKPHFTYKLSFALAVKCNTDPLLLQTLAALGSGFDCASKNEIATILDLGVDPSRIIYANTCKQASYIRLLTAFDIS